MLTSKAAKKKIARNTGLQIAGKAGVFILSFGLTAILTRYLGARGYGEYTIVFAFVSIFAILADWGLKIRVTKKMSRDFSGAGEVLGKTLGLEVALSAAVLAIAAAVVFVFPYSEAVKFGVGIGAAATFLFGLAAMVNTVFQAKLRMGQAVVSDLIYKGVPVGLTAVLVLMFPGQGGEASVFYLILATVVVGAGAALIYSSVAARRLVRFRLRWDWRYWGKVLVKSIPLGLVVVLGIVHFRVDTLILSFLRDASEVGFYGVGVKFLEAVLVLPAVFIAAAFPVMARFTKKMNGGGDGEREKAGDRGNVGIEAEDEKRKEGLRRTVQDSFDFLVLIGVFFAVFLGFFALEVVEIVAGADFGEAVRPLQFLVPAIVIGFLNYLFSYLAIAVGAQKRIVWAIVVGIFVNVALNFLLIPIYGAVGAAAATVVSEGLTLAWIVVVAVRAAGVWPGFRKVPAIVLAGAVSIGVAWLVRKYNVYLAAGVGAAIYFLILYWFRVFGRGILKSVLGKEA